MRLCSGHNGRRLGTSAPNFSGERRDQVGSVLRRGFCSFQAFYLLHCHEVLQFFSSFRFLPSIDRNFLFQFCLLFTHLFFFHFFVSCFISFPVFLSFSFYFFSFPSITFLLPFSLLLFSYFLLFFFQFISISSFISVISSRISPPFSLLLSFISSNISLFYFLEFYLLFPHPIPLNFTSRHFLFNLFFFLYVPYVSFFLLSLSFLLLFLLPFLLPHFFLFLSFSFHQFFLLSPPPSSAPILRLFLLIPSPISVAASAHEGGVPRPCSQESWGGGERRSVRETKEAVDAILNIQIRETALRLLPKASKSLARRESLRRELSERKGEREEDRGRRRRWNFGQISKLIRWISSDRIKPGADLSLPIHRIIERARAKHNTPNIITSPTPRENEWPVTLQITTGRQVKRRTKMWERERECVCCVCGRKRMKLG